MLISVAPALQVQRDLLDLPRGMERFDAYTSAMVDGDDILLPLSVFNPMAREHVADLLDRLIAVDAEGIAGQACADAASKLELDGALKVCLVIADDEQGGWTNRYITDFEYRYTRKGSIAGWVQVLLWTSEAMSAEEVKSGVLRAVSRDVEFKRTGLPTTLRQILAAEGRAADLAGSSEAILDPEEADYTVEILGGLLDSSDRGVQMAALYGDEAAKEVGYEPLGLAPWAGLAVCQRYA